MQADGTRIVRVEPIDQMGWQVTVVGHPTVAIARAYRLLDLLFAARWQITEIRGIARGQLDSEFETHVTASYK